MPRAKPNPERKSRSGSYVPNDLRGTVRVEIRCSPELAERARRAASRRQVTLAEVLEAGVNNLEEAKMRFSTVRDMTAAVAETLGLEHTNALEDVVRDAVPGRYEDVTLDDAFLRAVWQRAEPKATYPF
jgi:hypothetical protein